MDVTNPLLMYMWKFATLHHTSGSD